MAYRLFRILACSIVFLLSSCIASFAQCPGDTGGMGAFNHEALTISTTALSLTASTYGAGTVSGSGASRAILEIENDTLRYLTTGAAPTSSVGIQLGAGSIIYLCNPGEIARFRAIRSGSTDAKIQASYYRARE